MKAGPRRLLIAAAGAIGVALLAFLLVRFRVSGDDGRMETRMIRRDAQDVVQTLWPDKDLVTFRAPDANEEARFASLVDGITRAARAGDALPLRLVEEADSLGLALQRWDVDGRLLYALTEPVTARRGAGAFLFRTGTAASAQTSALQAPHAYFDRGTGEIALRIFLEAPDAAAPRAFFTNTAQRFRGRPGERRSDRDHPADVAHAKDSFFQAATRGFLEAEPRARIIQLHGFAAETVAAAAGGGASAPDVIVSAGGPSTADVRSVTSALSAALPFPVRTYPDEIDILGGTTNVQRRLVARSRGARFLHLETSAKLRDQLLQDPALRERFAAAVLAPAKVTD